MGDAGNKTRSKGYFELCPNPRLIITVGCFPVVYKEKNRKEKTKNPENINIAIQRNAYFWYS